MALGILRRMSPSLNRASGEMEAILIARFSFVAITAISLFSACSQPQATSGGAARSQSSGVQKTITVGISDSVNAFAIMGSSTTAGGWQSLNELHSQGLVTADREVARPVPRLAQEAPSLERGTLAMLPDGRMKSVYS